MVSFDRQSGFLLDRQQPVVLRQPFALRNRADLDLIPSPADGQIGEPVVFGLAAPRTDGHLPPRAARQFQRTFVLADGMQVQKADLKNGLLSIDLARPEPARIVRTIQIAEHE